MTRRKPGAEKHVPMRSCRRPADQLPTVPPTPTPPPRSCLKTSVSSEVGTTTASQVLQQPHGAVGQLQVNVEDAAAQPAWLARHQLQGVAGGPPHQLVRHQQRRAAQYGLLGARQAALEGLGEPPGAGGARVGDGGGCVGRAGLTALQAVVPEVKFWNK
ncbi:LOW QUALITY PROTEIN: hypothetical protein CRUP_037633 [Coryphaenoides rupestris]|nr:LOW QUALITY PROTEIN: hypothetical protein CRUP_037633 [Coryphaenoides rupestris]